MGRPERTHVCFTVGSAVNWESAVLFGNMIAEPPIVLDYLTKTLGSLLPTGPSQPERDWWDEGPLTERATSYEKILRLRKHGLSNVRLKELAAGKIPDLLTYRGLSAAQLSFSRISAITGLAGLAGFGGFGTRHEFYEIKPRSLSGIKKGTEKVAWLNKAYATLPYKAGTLYPLYFYPPDGVVELPLLMMDQRHKSDWDTARSRIKARRGIKKLELTIEVRPYPTVPGLLLYRICVTSEYEDDQQTDAEIVQTAREAVNAFVMSALVAKPRDIYREVTAFARDLEPALLGRTGKPDNPLQNPPKPKPVLFPMVDIKLEGVPTVIRPLLRDLRDAVNTRRLGLPGDRFLLCCDEAFYQSVVVSPDALAFINYLRKTPLRWANYVKERSGLGVLEAVQEAKEIFDFAKAIGMAGFKPLVDWSAKHPEEAVLIGVGVVVVSALAFWALPVMASELAALQASMLAATTVGMSEAFIEATTMSTVLMEEATAMELASAANVSLDAALAETADAVTVNLIRAEASSIATATTVSVAGDALATAEQVMLRQASSAVAKRIAQESLKATALSLSTAAVGTTIVLGSRTALAAPSNIQGGGKPTPPNEQFNQVIGTQMTRMFLLRPEPEPKLPPWPGPDTPPARRKPFVGEKIDAARFSPEAAASLQSQNMKSFECRYLGDLIVL